MRVRIRRVTLSSCALRRSLFEVSTLASHVSMDTVCEAFVALRAPQTPVRSLTRSSLHCGFTRRTGSRFVPLHASYTTLRCGSSHDEKGARFSTVSHVAGEGSRRARIVKRDPCRSPCEGLVAISLSHSTCNSCSSAATKGTAGVGLRVWATVEHGPLYVNTIPQKLNISTFY